jgi:hypothetical protein
MFALLLSLWPVSILLSLCGHFLPLLSAMGKRAAPSTPGSGTKAKRGSGAEFAKDSSGDADNLAVEVAMTEVMEFMTTHEWAGKVLERYDEVMAQHGDAISFLESTMPTNQARLEHAAYLDEMFPADPNPVWPYITNWDTKGPKLLRPYHLSWHKQAGNKGFIYRDKLRNLVTLIMAKGFLTNPEIPGVELPIITNPNPAFFNPVEFEFPSLENGLVDVGGVHCVKGWTRGVGLHVFIQLLKMDGLMDTFLISCSSAKLDSFRSIYANFLGTDAAKDMDLNRGAPGTCFCGLVRNNVHKRQQT